MALQHKSAGNSAASGNAATSGTSSLVQARDTRSAGAFFIGDAKEVLDDEVGGLHELCVQLQVVLEFIRSDREDASDLADALTCVALAQLNHITQDLESLARDCRRQAEKLGVSHG